MGPVGTRSSASNGTARRASEEEVRKHHIASFRPPSATHAALWRRRREGYAQRRWRPSHATGATAERHGLGIHGPGRWRSRTVWSGRTPSRAMRPRICRSTRAGGLEVGPSAGHTLSTAHTHAARLSNRGPLPPPPHLRSRTRRSSSRGRDVVGRHYSVYRCAFHQPPHVGQTTADSETWASTQPGSTCGSPSATRAPRPANP